MKDSKLNKLFTSNIITPLKGFCATVENDCNMTKTAEKMFSTEATISRQVKNLEEQLGIKLFEKIGKTLKITKDGERLYRLAIPKIKDMQNIFMEFQNEKKNEEEKIINIAAHHVILSHVLPKYLKKFRELHSDVKITLFNIDREEALEKMKKFEVDFAIYPYDDIPVEFESKKIFEFEPYIMMHKDNSLAKRKDNEILLEDILKNNNLNLGKGMTMPLIKDIITDKKMETDISLINGSWEILKGLIKENLGITGVAACYINTNDKELVYKNVFHILPNIIYKLVFYRNKHFNKFQIDILNILKENK